MTKTNRPLPYADDIGTIPADEADDIQRVIQALELILARSQAKRNQFRADVHVKTHGYAQGEFRVLPNLPDELAQGLFEHEGVYSALVRFSNAASQSQPDVVVQAQHLHANDLANHRFHEQTGLGTALGQVMQPHEKQQLMASTLAFPVHVHKISDMKLSDD